RHSYRGYSLEAQSGDGDRKRAAFSSDSGLSDRELACLNSVTGMIPDSFPSRLMLATRKERSGENQFLRMTGGLQAIIPSRRSPVRAARPWRRGEVSRRQSWQPRACARGSTALESEAS